MKVPFGVPFELRNPASVGINISDSSLRRLVTDAKPCQYRRVWHDRETGDLLHRTVWATAVSGCAMVGESTRHGFSTLGPFIRAWIGYLGKVQFFVVPIKDCVYDPAWGMKDRLNAVMRILTPLLAPGRLTMLPTVLETLMHWGQLNDPASPKDGRVVREHAFEEKSIHIYQNTTEGATR